MSCHLLNIAYGKPPLAANHCASPPATSLLKIVVEKINLKLLPVFPF